MITRTNVCSFLKRAYSSTSVLLKTKKTNKLHNELLEKTFHQKITSYNPKSELQSKYVCALNDDDSPIVISLGPAGCGKTFFACISAIHSLKKGITNKIVITRPVVPVENEDIGFLPGDIQHKMDPWTRPIFDIFSEFFSQKEIKSMISNRVIEISPLAYMRGRTFKDTFIIADEMQNSTPSQMLMLSTRIGENSKLVITGDLKQSDRNNQNGLFDIIQKIKSYSASKNNINISMIEMDIHDVQRSPIVKQIIDIYSFKEENKTMNPPRKYSTNTAIDFHDITKYYSPSTYSITSYRPWTLDVK